jgi:hypothetical protein
MRSQACQNAGAATHCRQRAPHMNFTPRTRSNTPFLAQIFRMSRTSGSGLYSTTVTASSSCRMSASTSSAVASTDSRARSAHASP